MAETSTSSQNPTLAINPVDHLPLSILKSDPIPPAPTRSASTLDWLPDFAGYSWVAYGASSLLVISHFPSPLSRQETLIGPIFRQVFELSGNHSPVAAVSWSPVTPSIGEVAAASENCICVFTNDSTSSKGSFCWSQNAVLVQSSKVEAIQWAGCGDGMIAGGIDVVLWRRRNMSWEIAWKFKRDLPQDLVSTTWSVEGVSATSACGAGKSVLVCYGNGTSEYTKVDLQHPQPVSMIQWRPATGRQLQIDAKHSQRHVLLTCCLDGTVRLWTEVDNGKGRKFGKDNNDNLAIRKSFCVAAVIEINQALKGTLGMDIFLSWAVDIEGIHQVRGGTNQFFSAEGNGQDMIGRCEWLIGFGPGTLVTFWAIHCLDDISPMRFPRVMLWRRQELQDLEVGRIHEAGFSKSENWLLLQKIAILRNCLSGPPNICFLVHLSPSNSLVSSLLYAHVLNNNDDNSLNKHKIDNYLTCSAASVLSIGHTGKILQVVMHPHIYEVDLAASLDSDGLLLFWSVSTISNCKLGLSTVIPTWRICGKLVTSYSCSKYTSLRWAPSILGEDHVLLLGHVGGIDCFLVKISDSGEEDIICHYICTIPLTGHGPFENSPTNIFTIPLTSTCNKTFKYNRFLLLGVWMNGFQALSWEVTLHSYDLPRCRCDCNFDNDNIPTCHVWKFENTFANRKYCLIVNPWSSHLPQPDSHNQITSFAVACSGHLIPVQENLVYDKELSFSVPAYVMATGCSDGTVKLWRSNSSKQLAPHVPWELVGKFTVHQGPVSVISVAECGQKIATICGGSHLDGISVLQIWGLVHLKGAGSFVLEDRISIDRNVIALSWMPLGNGQLFLGVCVQNELQVYAQKRAGSWNFLNSRKSLDLQNWYCIAVAHTFAAIDDFVWGPWASLLLVHGGYFSLLSQWLFLIDNKQQADYYPNFIREDSDDGKDNDIHSTIFTDCDIEISDFKEPLVENRREYKSAPPITSNIKEDCLSTSLLVAKTQLKHGFSTMRGFWSLAEIAEKLRGAIPFYHPEALLMNICSGNWKRAYNSVRHLVEYLNYASEKRCSSANHSHIMPEICLSDYFGGFALKVSVDGVFNWSADVQLPTSSSEFFAYNSKSDASFNMLCSSSTKSELSSFVEPIENLYDLAALTNIEKLQILAIIDLLNEIQHSASAYENLDEVGRRFWVALRFQQLNISRSSGTSPSLEELVADTRLMTWAFHSDCQETLLNSFLPSEPSWNDMRTLGVGFWFTNIVQLRSRMEKLARKQYLRNRDPKDCALLYIALNRLQVLAGLFKISKDDKDKPLVGFLSRNFQEEKNKAAALKNAYVLMGRHQFELAIAFFLLGGDPYSAITVCAKNLGDEQLALVICRLVEGRGGSLEHHLISKFILPSANERGDFWLASLLEWELGNYSRSFLVMLGLEVDSVASALSSNDVAFMDPHIGLYCLSLAAKNSVRNAIGEQNAALLGRWATVMAATAFDRCGLRLEALECLSSSLSNTGSMDEGSDSDAGYSQILPGILKPSASDSFNWLSGNVALHLESYSKLELALQYFSKLMREHPSWPGSVLGSARPGIYLKDLEIHHHEKLAQNLQEKLYTGLSNLEQKFSVVSSCVIEMILIWLCNNGLSFIGYDILVDYTSRDQSQNKTHTGDDFALYPIIYKPLLKAIRDISLLLSRFIAFCSITCLLPKSWYSGNDAQGYCFEDIIQTLWSVRTAIRTFLISAEDVAKKPLAMLDLFEYYIHFASAWLQRNSKGLLLMVQPLLITCTNGHMPYEVDMANLRNVLHHIVELLASDLSMDDELIAHKVSPPHEQDVEIMRSFSEDEKWHVLGACLWQHMYRFMNHKLHSLSIEFENKSLLGVFNDKASSWATTSMNCGSDNNSLREQIESFTLILAKALKTTLEHVNSYHVKLLASFLQKKLVNRLQIPTLVWLEESKKSQAKALYRDVSADVMNSKDESSTFDILWNTCADPDIITEGFEREKINWSQLYNHKSSKSWGDVFKNISGEQKIEEASDHEGKLSDNLSSSEVGSAAKGLFRNSRTLLSSWQKDATTTKEACYFENVREIYKRDGELLEAICINSTNEWQAALASNRKGIIFFSWEYGLPSCRDHSEYIWSDADWPPNGWAGAESTPVPTCVSPGVGLGSKQGAHLGLGGATIGMGSLARPRTDLTGGGAFGIPGYAGIGASGLGWEIQEDFEEFIDPPATIENISARAFSSHPSRPFFLAGSSNTHIYLWEFGKDKATATYGVLPAANVPPPYALASISALQFDHCGHRFANAALDGTVCTWQLEVGGRSNVGPTESSLCFNGHASDVSYFTSSGSVIAAAGYSSNGVNVVIWDTLAPPTTSQASIICHEGGACSISVFDNDIGSGSVSPLIVTGGKSGDVGLHDFRYIATGKTKRIRHLENGDASSKSSSNINPQTGVGKKTGDHNPNGMLWYIPKAHLGGVTKISTIPNTSLFLTGGKDGDVKLWDAKAATLVYHWPKLHERRTFLQSNSRGFGRVVRAAVTDIQVVSQGFISCGGDGSAKLVQLKDYQCRV